MTETHVSPAQLQEGPGTTPEVQHPLQAEAVARPAGWTGGRVAALVIGTLLVLVALVLLGAGGTGLWADLTQREAGYVTTGEHQFSTAGSALATESTHLGSPGVGWLYSPGLLGKVRIRLTPVSAGSPLFVGIGRSSDVDRYLAGVNHTVISDFFGNKVKTVDGGAPRSAPATKRFWAASSSGTGAQTLKWNPHGGSWTVVVMKADAKPGIGVRADLGARFPAVLWIAIGLSIAGAVFLAGGGLVIVGAVRGRRASPARAGVLAGPESPVAAADDERRSHAER